MASVNNPDFAAIELYMNGGPHPACLHNITRVNAKKACGWFVRALRGYSHVRKFFSDQSCGDAESALLEAIRYRDHLLSVIPPKILPPVSPHTQTRHLSLRRVKRGARYYQAIVHKIAPRFAVYILPGKRSAEQALAIARARLSSP